ncbi:MAG: ATP-binding protein [Lachnospiraceae bacterium]
MVDLEKRLEQIHKMVDDGAYFTVNRARQYGKTTILAALARRLQEEYMVLSLDFQRLSHSCFENEWKFCYAFSSAFVDEAGRSLTGQKECEAKLEELARLKTDADFNLMRMFEILRAFCGYLDKPAVLIIDEVDSATNNQVFLDFLAQLRNSYLDRDLKGIVTFQSVILAGVYDIRNIRHKIRTDGEHKVNSPWNIAADFAVNMSFSQEEIAGMLEEYEKDYRTGMDIRRMSELLFDYTSGYPFLVSRLCRLMDEKIPGREDFRKEGSVWTDKGFHEAVRLILAEENSLFDSLIGKLREEPELNTVISSLLFAGESTVYNSDNPAISNAAMLGFVKNCQGNVAIANRIFETRLYNYFLSMAETEGMEICKASKQDKNMFIVDGHLNMKRILEKFVVHFNDLYHDRKETFIEEAGRKYFLLYLRPIINGTGNYYIESRTRTMGRTDVIVDYRGEQYVIEMKIWRGNEYHMRGEEQLTKYLDDYHKKKGYMLSFNFNKNKQIGVYEIVIGDKVLVEAVV